MLGNLCKAKSKGFSPLFVTVFQRPQRNLESIDPQFTIRRKMEQLREEKELVEQLREVSTKDYLDSVITFRIEAAFYILKK